MGITNHKGDIGEAAITLAAIKKGYWVSKMPQDCDYDLIIDRKDNLGPKRVQVKYRSIDKSGAFSLSLVPVGRNKNNYTVKSIDYFAIFLADTEECFLIPISEIPDKNSVVFRCTKSKNNQTHNVRYIQQFEKL